MQIAEIIAAYDESLLPEFFTSHPITALPLREHLQAFRLFAITALEKEGLDVALEQAKERYRSSGLLMRQDRQKGGKQERTLSEVSFLQCGQLVLMVRRGKRLHLLP